MGIWWWDDLTWAALDVGSALDDALLDVKQLGRDTCGMNWYGGTLALKGEERDENKYPRAGT